MKKSYLLRILVLSFLLLAVSCAKDIMLPQVAADRIEIDYGAPSFNAGFDTHPESRSYLGTDGKLYWNAEDMVSVFSATSDNQKYMFGGETGDRGGELLKVASDQKITGQSLSANYAVYPYSASTTISSDGTLTVNLPRTQAYAGSGFGAGANTMVAVTGSASDRDFIFQNASGYLVVKLYGKVSVSSVTLCGNNGEKISGRAEIKVKYGDVPAVTMLSDAESSITIDCGSGVTLGTESGSATEFRFVVPPVTFSKGFTIKVTDTQGRTFCKTTKKSRTVRRNLTSTIDPCSIITSPGEFVRTTCDAEIYDEDRITGMIYDNLGDQIPDGIIGNILVKLATQIISQNGDLVLNKIVYTTTDPYGNIVEASGLVCYPKNLSKFNKITSVQHVTYDIDEAPTLSEIPYELAAALKKGNQIVTIADYLGYGVSQTVDLQHPYMHSDITGRTCADMLEAAESFVVNHEGKTLDANPSIDLIGYSQGAAATISTLLELEKRGRSGNITGVMAGGGPYDLYAFLERFIEKPEEPFHDTGYLAYLVRGLVYGDRLDVDFRNIFAEEVFNSGAFQRFSTSYVSSWHGRLGSDVRKVFNSDFFELADHDPNPDVAAVLSSIERNSVSNRMPVSTSKISLYHSPADSTVPYQCSVNAQQKWGCKLQDLEKDTHDMAAVEFYCKYVNSTLWGYIKELI